MVAEIIKHFQSKRCFQIDKYEKAKKRRKSSEELKAARQLLLLQVCYKNLMTIMFMNSYKALS